MNTSILRGHHSERHSFHFDGWDCHGCGRTEVWVGDAGQGKSTYAHAILMREHQINGFHFKLIDPTNRGRVLADALGVTCTDLRPDTTLNPHDIVSNNLTDQVAHVVRLYEIVLQRELAHSRQANLERGLLVQALKVAYAVDSTTSHWEWLNRQQAPTCTDVLTILREQGDDDERREIARNLADELANLVTGSGVYAGVLDGHTGTYETRRPLDEPRTVVYTLQSLSGPLMNYAVGHILGNTYIDQRNDEPSRLMPEYLVLDGISDMIRTPGMKEWLSGFPKTFRHTRRALICIDRSPSFFFDGPARFMLESASTSIFFRTSGQRDAFADFHYQHLTTADVELIESLPPHHFVFDGQDAGHWPLMNRMSPIERRWLLPKPVTARRQSDMDHLLP